MVTKSKFVIFGVFLLIIFSSFNQPTTIKGTSTCTPNSNSCAGGNTCPGACGQLGVPGTYCGQGPDCTGQAGVDQYGNPIPARWCNCWQFCCLVCNPGDCSGGPTPIPTIAPTSTPGPTCGTCDTSNCANICQGSACGSCSVGGGTCASGTKSCPPPPTTTPVQPPPSGTGSILGRIVLTDPQGNQYVSRPFGETWGQAQCDNTPQYATQITINGSTYSASNCNGGGPYYGAGNLGAGSYLINLNSVPNESWTWTCSTDGSASNCPAASGPGLSVRVNVEDGHFTHVWFYMVSTPTCSVTPANGLTNVCAGQSTQYNTSAAKGGVKELGLFSSSTASQSWTTILPYTAYSSGNVPVSTTFSTPGNYYLVCNARNPDTYVYSSGNPWCTGIHPAVSPWGTALPNVSCQPNSGGAWFYNPGATSKTNITVSNAVGVPTPLTVTAALDPPAGPDKVKINWNLINATNYVLSRQDGAGTFNNIFSTTSASTYEDTVICDGTLHTYRVTASDPSMPAACNTTVATSLSVSCASAWWLLSGGGSAIAANTLKSIPPLTQYVCLPTAQNVCGVGVGGTSVNSTTSSNWAPPSATGDWVVTGTGLDTAINSSFIKGKYDYDYLYNRAKDLVPIVDDPGSTIAIVPGFVASHSAGYYAADQTTYVHATAANLTLNSASPMDLGNNRVVIFAEGTGSGNGGTVTIGRNLTNHDSVTGAYGEFVLISRGDIQVAGSVDTLEGVYFTNGTFNTGNDNVHTLSVNGSVIGLTDVSLIRGPANPIPRETFKYIPSYYTNFPQGLLRRHVIQSLVNP